MYWNLGLSLLLAVASWPSSSARAEATRTQTISLRRGWNAVFVEVYAGNPDPAAVFQNVPVTIAATFLATTKSIEFITNPSEIQWKKEGWRVWYAPGRPDAFLSNLRAIYGNRTYLLYAAADCTLQLTGTAQFEPPVWKSDSFNLTGFCLDEQSPPTFDQFFSGSPAHRGSRIYRLVNDQWTLVTDPVRTAMHSGEAYWIYCQGRSDYQGPVAVKLPTSRGIDFSSGSDNWLTVVNQGADPVAVRIERISSSGDLPLAYVLRGITAGNMQDVNLDFPTSYQLPTLEPGTSSTLRLALRRERMAAPAQSALLKISTDSGMQLWVPVTGTKSSLSAAN